MGIVPVLDVYSAYPVFIFVLRVCVFPLFMLLLRVIVLFIAGSALPNFLRLRGSARGHWSGTLRTTGTLALERTAANLFVARTYRFASICQTNTLPRKLVRSVP